MLHNIDNNKMSALLESNEDVKQLITQLLENHHTIVSTISHELRNSLTLIASTTQLIESQHPEVTDFYGWTQTVEDIRYMTRLLNDLSLFNNGNRLHTVSFSMERLLKSIVVSYAVSLSELRPDIEFSSSVPSDLGEFTGDSLKLQEVILNLLRNAEDAISGKGKISLSAIRQKDAIQIEITDSGCGISTRHLETIFDPFCTYKQGGTGLGLALSKQIVTAHGGTLSVSSVEGIGSTFTIALPL